MSKAANLAGFATAVSPPSDLTVGIITATTVSATNITGTVTGDATGLSGTPDIDVRNITGVAATFTGNVSIAGTLTYEDVTNVDSVGLITARSGVDVTGGSVVVGSAVTISSGGVLAGVVTATTGCITGTFTGATICGGTVCATTGFSGDGANVTNIPASNITGLSGGGGFCVYTSPGTFPVPPGTTSLKITAIGGGGNGQPCTPIPTPNIGMIGGDASIASVKLLSVPPSCSSYPVTIGGAGGDTVFGGPTVFLVTGGDPASSGTPITDRGCGLAPPTATYGLGAAISDNPACITPAVRTFYGKGFCGGPPGQAGSGGGSLFGKGGNGGGPTGSLGPGYSGNGYTGCGYGSGGGGAALIAGCLGGTGAPGFMVVEW